MSKDSQVVAVLDPSVRIVKIPVGRKNLGLDFADSPPRVTKVDPTSPLEGQVDVGLYVHALILPELEVINIRNAKHLMDFLDANIAQERELWLSPSQNYVDTSLGSRHTDALYKHKLPATPYLGLTMDRFPPIILQVAADSPVQGRIIPGQTVEALLIPGRQRMDLTAGAFTAAKVSEALSETSNVNGRVLVVKDAPHGPTEKGTSQACVCEDCVIS